MRDYQDFCEMHGGSTSDPDFLNKWLIKEEEHERLLEKHKVSAKELEQFVQYVGISQEGSFTELKHVNNYISENGLWEKFPDIRSLNDHGDYTNIPGILP
ncbi:hypothetical protein CR155_12180 [Pollutimonas nitritireducens]|uniref:Uncharacterized protein n=1 Tax=Pollutimonas nitritireducens TaxID=2045209 RepID=A0A2N4UEX7_9BURK|nr:hypothetical protein [Pollutimonas nitritireducens]PLC53578.1 hypothetical protein CR155_12180 [Pollutimonas nitritireducens]